MLGLNLRPFCVPPLGRSSEKGGGNQGATGNSSRLVIFAVSCDGNDSFFWGSAWTLQNGWSSARKDTCRSLGVWVYACAWVWFYVCFCLPFPRPCLSVLGSCAYVYTDSSARLKTECQTVKICLVGNGKEREAGRAHVESAKRLALHQTVRLALFKYVRRWDYSIKIIICVCGWSWVFWVLFRKFDAS